MTQEVVLCESPKTMRGTRKTSNLEMRYLLCLSSELSVNVLCFQYDMRTSMFCVFSMICSDMRDDMRISCSDMRDDMRSGA